MTQSEFQMGTTNIEPYPLEAIHSAPVRTLISEYLVRLLQTYQSADPSTDAKHILEIMVTSTNVAEAENKARNFMHKDNFIAIHRAISTSRAELYSNQILPWILGGNVLDLGCGNGLIGVRLEQQCPCTVAFADTINYLDVERPFVTLSDQIPFADRTFDTTVIITVLHHTLKADQILREAARVTRRRLLIKESVIDVHFKHRDLVQHLTPAFLELTKDQQFLYTCFVDWFFNRILETGIAVPFTFRTPLQWQQSLDTLGTIESAIDLGIDDSIGALYHVLFVVNLYK